MNVVADLIILLTIIICSYFGYRKGLIRTVFNFFGGLVSFTVASFLAKPTGTFFASAFLKPIFNNYAEKLIADQLSTGGAEESQEAFSSLLSFLRFFGLDQADLDRLWEQAENNALDFVRVASEKVVSSFAESLGYALAFFVLFVLVFIAFKILVRVLDLIAKLPILNFSNRTLGLFLGFSFGVMLSFAFSGLLYFVEPILQSSNSEFFAKFSFEKTFLADSLWNLLKF